MKKQESQIWYTQFLNILYINIHFEYCELSYLKYLQTC